MRAVFRLCGPHSHKPLIRFIGKRIPESKPHTPRPHPAAPPQVASHFSDFLKKFNASSRTASSATAGDTTDSQIYRQYWEAPPRYWTRSHQMSEIEIEAVLSGGASLTH